eukprot:TRINITY_DN11567_c0_g1_i1.p1 TRINITY_DN11567_c0_g1~~TRINITY_DN11567_c0_g1_i1.p1  ORF type:complete len:213 (+),score=23.86 TRINITY_DN11567_c0_g1_i1:275-913(+)
MAAQFVAAAWCPLAAAEPPPPTCPRTRSMSSGTIIFSRSLFKSSAGEPDCKGGRSLSYVFAPARAQDASTPTAPDPPPSSVKQPNSQERSRRAKRSAVATEPLGSSSAARSTRSTSASASVLPRPRARATPLASSAAVSASVPKKLSKRFWSTSASVAASPAARTMSDNSSSSGKATLPDRHSTNESTEPPSWPNRFTPRVASHGIQPMSPA